MGKAWEIDTHTFAIVWAISPHTIPILRYTTSNGKAWVSPSISHSTGKWNKTHRRGEPGKLVLILFPYYGRFFPLDSDFMVYFITWEMHVFSY